MRKWLIEDGNWFPVALCTILVVGGTLTGILNGWT